VSQIIGRDGELRRLAAALEDARAGRGRLFTIAGEPGIGKTRLCDELARLASDGGTPVAWGRCWEAGGAPPYWPWIEILRGLAIDPPRDDEDVLLAFADVARIVPSYARKLPGGISVSPLDPMEARFRLFESIATVLAHASSNALVVIVDDAHVADESSLKVLQFVARSIRTRKVLVLVTVRDAAARPTREAAGLLHEIAREGEKIALGRLTATDVQEWLSEQGLATDTAKAVFDATEGNPLFVDETIRWIRARSSTSLTVPDEVRAAIDAHVRMLEDDAREILAIASVLGRSIESRLLAIVAERPLDAIDRALRNALSVRVIEDTGDPDRFRFAHILIGEQLERSLPSTRRTELHWKLGKHFAALGDEHADRAAHHLSLGLDAGRADELVEMTLRAARRAMTQLAFEDAVQACERALALVPSGGRSACELTLVCGEAKIRAGQMRAGQKDCVVAADLARALGDSTLFARAALVYGTELIGGTVDAQMVTLLRQALELVPESERGLRARVMARLASAMVPSTNEVHMEAERIAKEALAVARSLDDPPTLYAVLQWTIPAMGFSIDAVARLTAVSEMLDHAVRLGDSTGIIRARLMMILQAIENGDPALDGLFREFTEHIESLKRPLYQWRLPMLRSVLATFDGRFEDARREADEVLRITKSESNLKDFRLWGLLRTSTLHALGDPTAYPEDGAAILGMTEKVPFAHYFRAWGLAVRGRLDEARDALVGAPPLNHSLPLLAPISEVACLIGDVELGKRIYELLKPEETRNPQPWGPSGAMCISPTSIALGRLAAMLGRLDEAVAHFEHGIARCERSRMRPHLAWAQHRLAEVLRRRAGPGDLERERAFRERARASAVSMGMTALVAAIDGVETQKPQELEEAITPIEVVLAREGDVWSMSVRGRSIRLRDSKGVRYLDVLLRNPKTEVHVSQLLGGDDGVLAGDAGPMLDAEAKNKYRERLEDLRDALEEANRFGDRTRADRVQEEIDAIADELARGVGLGGRDRKAASATERARINVQRRIRDVIDRVSAASPNLGRWLAASIRTGTYCSYVPVSVPPLE